MAKRLYTIGYSGFQNVSDFIETLKSYGVQIVIDVRSSPFSAHFEAYNKDRLSVELKKNGLYYFNYARQFGARQDNPQFYKNGRLDFEIFSHSAQFLDGVSSVENSNGVIAFMCAEKHPSDCHRAIMVARAFSLRGYSITHIKPGGITLTQHDIDEELLQKYFPNRDQAALPGFGAESYSNDDDYIRAAYILRNDEIGFKLEDLK